MKFQVETNTDPKALLSPCALNLCSHIVQFYDGEPVLLEKVSEYLAPGLLKGEAGLAIVEPRRIDRVKHALRQRGIAVEEAMAEGRLVILNSSLMLGQFMRDGNVDKDLVRKVLGGLLTQLQAKFKIIHAYGEMVNVLWTEGNAKATLELEREWDALTEEFPLFLLCGYQMGAFDKERDVNFINEIYSTHQVPLPLGIG